MTEVYTIPNTYAFIAPKEYYKGSNFSMIRKAIISKYLYSLQQLFIYNTLFTFR